MIPWKEWDGVRRLGGLIFDCDGVLFDSYGSNVSYYNAIKAGLGLPPMTPDEEYVVHVSTVFESIAYIVPRERLEEALQVRQRLDYNQVALPHLVPEPGLVELLLWLKSQGVRMAVSTNRTTTMEAVLDHFGLAHFFFPVMTAAKVRAKPLPDAVFKILESWRLSPDEVAFIGDSAVDMRTARAAGVPFWSYKNFNLAARVHVPCFWKMRRVLQQAFVGLSNPLV